MRPFILVVGLTALVSVAMAQNKVDQGQPGKQGPWPVTLSGSMISDAGAVIVQASTCSNPVESVIIYDGGAATPCPVVSTAGRKSVLLCNSPRNTGTPQWTVAAGGATPTTAVTSVGQVLNITDCISYMVGATLADGGVPLQCIVSGNTSTTALLITECQ